MTAAEVLAASPTSHLVHQPSAKVLATVPSP